MTLLSRSPAPVVIAHRGASGYRPEHTLGAYRLAIALGADCLEPDLVSTRDGVLVARHENEIGGTTDVATRAAYADRRRTKVVDGERLTGWFTEDFTLAELKTLFATERLPGVRPANTRYDGHYDVATLDEILLLVRQETVRTGRDIRLCLELKHSTYFRSLGLPLEENLLATLRDHDLDRRGSGVVVESFETANLRWLRERTDVPLIQLVEDRGAPPDCVASGDPTTYADLVTPHGLRMVAGYADAISVRKELVLPRDPATGATTAPTSLVESAHLLGLEVLVFTLRDENQFMATDFRRGTDPNAPGDAFAEARALFAAGVDGVFSDHPDTTLAAREEWQLAQTRAS